MATNQTTDPAVSAERDAPPAAWRVALVLAAASALFVVNARRPPTPVPASAPARAFSAERAWRHVEALAARPHPIGTAAHDSARAYVERELHALGLDPELQAATGIGTRGRSAARVVNVVARVPGTARGEKAILVAVHYDGVPAGPAAGDDGAGVAAVLEMLRALGSGPPLANDLIICVTDGEEMGLLGAAAFVTEHRWAKDVALVLDFEARGTSGRSTMFETGANNLDVVRTLRTVSDVSTSSMMVTVYRNLPNDTDLSEFARLGQPALNFAFIGGVTRYHTPFDDAKHLDPGSLQHHGQQMLALVQRFGREPLPRPASKDAVFFDLPVVGVVWYPESWALPLALLVALAALSGAVRDARDESHRVHAAVLAGVACLASVAAAAFASGWAAKGIVALHVRTQWDGEPAWSGVYALAGALLALAIASGAWALVRRWAGARGAWVGAIVVWSALAIASALYLPGVSYLFAWPLAGAAVLAWSQRYDGRVSEINGWSGVLLALALLAPVAATVGAYALPLDQLGAQAAALLVALTAWLLAPKLDEMLGTRPARGALLVLGLSLVVTAYGMATIRRSDAAPTPVNLIYAMEADSGAAWLTVAGRASVPGSWAAGVIGANGEKPGAGAAASVLTRSFGWGGAARRAPRLALAASRVEVTGMMPTATGVQYSLHVVAPAGAHGMSFRTEGATVTRAQVDGQVVDMSRYRRASTDFTLAYLAPRVEGMTLTLDVKGASGFDLDVTTIRFGIDAAALAISPRPPNVVPVHQGDQMLVVQRLRLGGR